jgi:hypothetical protein
VAAFGGRLPGDGSKGALEEGVVDDVTLVIFAFDDPVAWVGFALSGVSEDEGGVEALGGVDEKRSAGAEAVHLRLSPAALFRRRRVFQHQIHKNGVMVFVNFRKEGAALFAATRKPGHTAFYGVLLSCDRILRAIRLITGTELGSDSRSYLNGI